MSALPEYYHHLTCHRGLSPAEAMDRLALVQNKFASHGARRAFFAKLRAGHIGGAAKKGAAKGGGVVGGSPQATSLPQKEADLIGKAAAGAQRREARERQNREDYERNVQPGRLAQIERNQPEWTTVQGVKVLKSPNSPLVAVPANGRENSANWEVIDPDKKELVALLKKNEVRGWLAKRSIAGEEAAAEKTSQTSTKTPPATAPNQTPKPAKPPKGLTPAVDAMLETIQVTGKPPHMMSAGERKALSKAYEKGWVKQINGPNATVLGYELTPAGQEVVGKSMRKESKTGDANFIERQVKKNAAASARLKRL